MRSNSNRNVKAFAILSAAAGLAAAVQTADAIDRTWNQSTGNWSAPGNWSPIGPILAGDNLLFPGAGATSYASTNDTVLGYGTLAVNHSGTGMVTLAGGGSFSNFVQTSGSVTLNAGSWNFTSTNRHNDFITGTNTGRWAVDIGDTPGTTNRFTMNGGTINAPGFFLGTDGAGTSNNIATFSSGAIVSTGTAGRFGVSESTGTINILSGSQVTSRLFDMGRQGDPDFPPANLVNATLLLDGANSKVTSGQLVLPRETGTARMTISNGAKWIGQAFDTITGVVFTASRRGGTTTALVTGAGSEINLPSTFITSGGAASALGDQYSAGSTDFTVSAGGAIKAQSFNFGQNNAGVTNFVVDGATSSISTIGQGAGTGGFSTSGNLGKTSDPAPGPATVVNLTWQNGAQGNFASNGVCGVIFTGSETNSGGGKTSVTVQSGASVSIANVFLLTANDDCVGTMTVNSGSLTVGGEMDFGSSLNTNAVVNISDGGRVTTSNSGTAGFTSTDVGSKTSVTVNNGTLAYASTFVASGGATTDLGDPLESGNTTISLSNGARMSAQSMNLGQNAAGFVDVTADGATTVMTSNGIGAGTGSWVTANNLGFVATPSRTRITVQNGATASLPGSLWGSGGLTGSNGGISTFTVQSGGKLNVGGFVVLSDPTTAVSHMTITGTNSQLTVGTSLLVGGNGTVTGGTASVTITDGASAAIGNLTNVYPNSTLTVGTGTLKGTFTGNTDGVGVDGTINFNAGTFNATGTLAVGGQVLLSSAARSGTGAPTNKKLLEVGQATLTSSGVVDLNDNDMLIHHNNRQRYENFVKAARNNGLWNQPGITSTAAKNASPKNKGLGVLSGTEYIAVNGTPFNGKTVVATDTVIKFTFNGDTDFNGVVNFDDYARTDSGFNNGRSGWLNGDFDYNGVVNFDDYSLIDNAFNTQGTVVLSTGNSPAGPVGDREIIRITDKQSLASASIRTGNVAYTASTAYDKGVAEHIVDGNPGDLQAVPEPGAISIMGLSALGAMRRRRRHS